MPHSSNPIHLFLLIPLLTLMLIFSLSALFSICPSYLTPLRLFFSLSTPPPPSYSSSTYDMNFYATSELKIRPATIEDVPAITDIIVDAFAPAVHWKYVYQFKDEFPRFHWQCVREGIEREFLGGSERGEDVYGGAEVDEGRMEARDTWGGVDGENGWSYGRRDGRGKVWVNVIDAPLEDDDYNDDDVVGAEEEEEDDHDVCKEGQKAMSKHNKDDEESRSTGAGGRRKRRGGGKTGQRRRAVSLAIWQLRRRSNNTHSTSQNFSRSFLSSSLFPFLNSPPTPNLHFAPSFEPEPQPQPQPLHPLPQSPLDIREGKVNCSLHLDVNLTRFSDYAPQIAHFEKHYINEAYDTQLYLAMLATHPDFDGRGYAARQLKWGEELARNISKGLKEEGGATEGLLEEKGETMGRKSGSDVEGGRMEEGETGDRNDLNVTLIATPAGWELYHTVGFEEIKNLTWWKVGGEVGGWFEVMVWRTNSITSRTLREVEP